MCFLVSCLFLMWCRPCPHKWHFAPRPSCPLLAPIHLAVTAKLVCAVFASSPLWCVHPAHVCVRPAHRSWLWLGPILMNTPYKQLPPPPLLLLRPFIVQGC